MEPPEFAALSVRGLGGTFVYPHIGFRQFARRVFAQNRFSRIGDVGVVDNHLRNRLLWNNNRDIRGLRLLAVALP